MLLDRLGLSAGTPIIVRRECGVGPACRYAVRTVSVFPAPVGLAIGVDCGPS